MGRLNKSWDRPLLNTSDGNNGVISTGISNAVTHHIIMMPLPLLSKNVSRYYIEDADVLNRTSEPSDRENLVPPLSLVRAGARDNRKSDDD